MADIEKDINIKVTADTTEAQQNLQNTTRDLDKLRQSADDTSKEVNKSADSLAKASSEAKKANPSLSEIWSNFKSGITHARSLKEAVNLVGTSLKALIANPIGAVIAAVGIAVKSLTDAFKRNDDAATALKRVMDLLQVPLKLLQRLVDDLVEGIGELLEGFLDLAGKLAEKVTPVLNKVNGTIQSITDSLGTFGRIFGKVTTIVVTSTGIFGRIFGNLFKLFKKAVGEGVELGKEQDELTKRQEAFQDRQLDFQERSSAREAKIAELREKISDAEHYRLNDRMKMLDEVEELEKEELNEKISMADEAIEIEKLRQKVENDSSDEAKKALSDLIVARNNANKQYEEAQRRYNRERERLRKEGSTQAAAAHAEEERLEKEHLKRLEDLRREHNQKLKDIDTERLNYLRNEAKSNDSLINSLAVLSEEYLQEQEKITKQIDEEAVNRAQRQKELLTATTQEEKDRLHGLIDTSEELTKQLGSNLGQITRLFQGNVANLINKVGGAFEDFQIDTTKTHQENLDAIQQTYDVATKQIEEAHKEGRLTDEEYAKAQQDLYSGMVANVAQLNNIAFQESVEENIKNAEEQIETYRQATSTLMDATASVFGDIANAYASEYDRIMASGDELSADQRRQAIHALEMQKAALIIQFAIQQAQAIGNAIIAATSAAASSGPAAAIVYAATLAPMIASIISSFISLKGNIDGINQQIADLKAPKKLATGGYVSGPGTATSDSIPARLSNGEAVINARSTAMYYDLLSKINQEGGGVAFPGTGTWKFSSGGVAMDMGMMVRAMKEAVSEIQPVVSVKEITNTQKRIAMKENR